MARVSIIFILLRNLENFVKSVPIDPKAPKYKEWQKCRAEVKKAIKDIDKMVKALESLQDSEKRLLRALLAPCQGKVPLRQISEAFLLPRGEVPIMMKEPSAGCGKPGPRSAA